MPVGGDLDLRAVILSLRAELERIDRTIAALEHLKEPVGADAPVVKPRSKRGRRSMNTEQRLEVAERMRRYWAQRREQR